MTAKTQKSYVLTQALPYILLICGIIGVLCAGILTVEKIDLLRNPTKPLACDINPIISCGSVINTPQASAFGFPNPLLGLVGFSVVAATGAALLAGARLKRWYWLGLQAGATFGMGFVFWLQYQSIFNIGALCPFCMVVWTIMIPIFWYVTLHNLREGHIVVRRKLRGFVDFLQRHHGDVLLVWYVAIIVVIMCRFWYFWQTLLP